ncbi:hypothetical protein [Actinophytocola oryzae]|uniref:Uncharacterized protein n=1 Tax=Actinophytocola oryzae TaxID=502181 RepID=A0A4R7V7J6_9PSEU|nr:hypothetical protein [Actinophytocola oryzae]TDV44857.1 hypothetical protein CLV71_113116 [Actinophytocola oryzae]
MNNTASHLLYALDILPGRGRLAARLGFRPRAWSLAAFPFAALIVFLVWFSWLYPLRPDAIGALGHPFTSDPLLHNAWGGPTLIGAWFIHAMAALGMQVICMAVIRRLNGRAPVEAV